MKVIDTHCDLLYKMQTIKQATGKLVSFRSDPLLDVNLLRLQAGGVFLQFFALFTDPNRKVAHRWELILEQIRLFEEEILAKYKQIKQIKKWSDIGRLKRGEIGAVLSLEGIEPIGEDLSKLHYLFHKGVLSVSLTWNQSNTAASGVLAPFDQGLTKFGEEIIALNNKYGVITDLSHLGMRSFWEVLERATYVFASHSNLYTVCPHRRNLTDIQVHSLFAKGGHVHFCFYPPFIDLTGKDSLDALIQHFIYVSKIKGGAQVGFGSDFDGIDRHLSALSNPSYYVSFINRLGRYFTEAEVEGFAYRNFLRFLGGIKQEEFVDESYYWNYSIDD